MSCSNCINFIGILEYDENIKMGCADFTLLNFPQTGKVFEKFTFNSLFFPLNYNNLFNSNQCRFRPGDSCVYQFILITNDIYKAFDANPSLEVRGVFLDLSEASDKFGMENKDDLLNKLKYFGLIGSFLSEIFQRVLLNGRTSKWSQIKVGVSQGSILGPLLFLVYINNLPKGLTSNAKLFAENTSIFSSQLSLNEELSKISNLAYK